MKKNCDVNYFGTFQTFPIAISAVLALLFLLAAAGGGVNLGMTGPYINLTCFGNVRRDYLIHH